MALARRLPKSPLTWTYVVELMGLEPTTPCLQSKNPPTL